MKVLVVNYEYPPVGGGAAQATRHLCRHLVSRDIAVDALVSKGAEAGISDDHGVRVISVPTSRRSIHETGPLAMVMFLLRGGLEVRHLLQSDSYDLIHFFFSVPTGLIDFVVQRNIPCIISLRGGDIPGYVAGEYSTMHRLLTFFNRSVLRRANAVVALSQDLADCAVRFVPGLDCEVIGNGVDLEVFSLGASERKNDSMLSMLAVGRLVEWKGVQHAIKALLSLPNVKLTVCGTGPYENELHELTQRLGLFDRVNFEGPVRHEKLPAYYAAADIFVLPSDGDSFGQVFSEAMAAGLPIVAARSHGVPEIVIDGENGILVPARDINALVNAINDLGADPLRRAEIGRRNAEKMSSSFTWRGVADQYLSVYRRVLAQADQSKRV